MLIPVLLSGGGGTRLWPVSRKSFPKQFVRLVDSNYSLFQQSAVRLEQLSCESSSLLVIGSEEHKFIISSQLEEVGISADEVILEPCSRDTAPAIALAALRALEKNSKARLLIVPADHHIPDSSAFSSLIAEALNVEAHTITFGIEPTHPETGFGYIKTQVKSGAVAHVDQFIEKPCLEDAKSFIESGEYFWNSGIFLIDAGFFLEELKKNEPTIYESCKLACSNGEKESFYFRPAHKFLKNSPAISVDYAVMQKIKGIMMLPFENSWADLGTWMGVYNHLPKDEFNNVFIGDVTAVDVKNCLARAGGRKIAVCGVDDLCIVDTPDALLVSKVSGPSSVRDVVRRLEELGDTVASENNTGHRPWGFYTVLATGPGYKIKEIVVGVGQSLSLQYHNHRSEHWVVAEGEATVINGEDLVKLFPGESTFIPQGATHRLSNNGTQVLKVIEVQLGAYLGEDDIIRLEDNYSR